MGFIGGFFVAVAVVIAFITAVTVVVCKLRAGEPLFGDEDGKRKIPKHIVIVFALIGAFFMLPYAAALLIAAVIWTLLHVIRRKSLDKDTMLKTAVLFLAAVGSVYSVCIAAGFLSALFRGQL